MPDGIVQIVQRLTPGGLEVLAIDLSLRLGGENVIFSLELTEAEMTRRWPLLGTLPLRITGFGKPAGLHPGLILKLARELKAAAPRAVLTHHVGPMLYGGLAARLAGVPVIAHVEHDVWHYASRSDRWIARLVGLLARPQVVAVSEAVAAAMRKLMPWSRISVIRNAVDTARFAPAGKAEARSRLGLPLDRAIVGAAGRLEEVKGQDVLLRALALLPGVLLVLAGDGSQAEAFQALAVDLDIAERVMFLGYRSDMEVVYPAFDVVALPSRAEGLPLSVLEAQACDIPVVASDVGSVREGLAPGASRLVPAGDAPALASALADLLAHPPAVGPRGFITEQFSWERMVAAYRRLLTP